MSSSPTLSIVSTQMQFINCIEYINENELVNNDVLFFSVSKEREKQLKAIYNIQCNKNTFRNVWFYSLGGNRLWGVLVSVILMLKLLLISKKKYSTCIVGNYRVCYGRLVWALDKHVSKVAVDDGLATITWYDDRKKELENGDVNIFYNNRIIRLFVEKRIRNAIPDSVTFYTIHKGIISMQDTIKTNNYLFLKKHSSEYPNAVDFMNCSAVFLGQPLYLHGELTVKGYNGYLRKALQLVNGKAIYYPHPEETSFNWMEKDIAASYTCIPNHFSFEIFAKALPDNCTVISFQTSTFFVLKMLCPNIRLTSVFINEMENRNDKLSIAWIKGYSYLNKNGVRVVNFGD